MFFVWDEWNLEHIATHDVEPFEAEQVIRSAKRPFPRLIGEKKWLARGRTRAGRLLQVIFVERPHDSIDYRLLNEHERVAMENGEIAAYVIHARDLRRGES